MRVPQAGERGLLVVFGIPRFTAYFLFPFLAVYHIMQYMIKIYDKNYAK